MKTSLDYLIENGFIRRIGEPLMNEFNYKNENYEDLTRSKNHLSKFIQQ